MHHWSHRFRTRHLHFHLLCQCIYADGVLRCPGRHGSGLHVCPRRHGSRLLVREEEVPGHWYFYVWIRVRDDRVRPSGDQFGKRSGLAVVQQDCSELLPGGEYKMMTVHCMVRQRFKDDKTSLVVKLCQKNFPFIYVQAEANYQDPVKNLSLEPETGAVTRIPLATHPLLTMKECSSKEVLMLKKVFE